MDYEVTVNIPSAGDTSVYIAGLGELKNGKTYTVDAEQAANFKTQTGFTLGRANFMEGIEAKALTGRKKPSPEAEPAGQQPEDQPHPEGFPAPVQNADGETAEEAK